MMKSTRAIRLSALTCIAISGALVLGACSSDSDSSDASADESPASSVSDTAMASETEPMSDQTIVEVASANPDFSTLVSAVQAAGLAETLSGPGPFTVFAPTNEAFAALPAGTLDSLLLPENKQQLADILTYHVVSGKVMAEDVTAGAVKTVNGADFTVGVEGSDVVITDGQGNQAKVVATDVPASNGVIHVIDAVLLPPTG
jgi:uncharacterized surface protein with fasciclin (FAS1) repeats